MRWGALYAASGDHRIEGLGDSLPISTIRSVVGSRGGAGLKSSLSSQVAASGQFAAKFAELLLGFQEPRPTDSLRPVRSCEAGGTDDDKIKWIGRRRLGGVD